MDEIVPCEPVINTISHENASTTMVRMAVATVGVGLSDTALGQNGGQAAKSAEPNAKKIHMSVLSPQM